MANIFDQFDAVSEQPQDVSVPSVSRETNVFDQFDESQGEPQQAAPQESKSSLRPNAIPAADFYNALEWSKKNLAPIGAGLAAGGVASAAVPSILGGIATSVIGGALGGLGEAAYKKYVQGEEVDLGEEALTGGAIGGAVGAIGKGLTGLYKSIKSVNPEVADELVGLAERHGIPLQTSDVLPPTTATGKLARETGVRAPYLSTAGTAEAQQTGRQGMINQLQQRYGEYSPDALVQDLVEKNREVRQAAGAKYGEVVDQMRDKPADFSNTLTVMNKEIDRLTKNVDGSPKSAVDETSVNNLYNFMDDIMSDSSFENMAKIRTSFREGVKGDQIRNWPNQSQAATNKIYSAMTDDLKGAVDSNLGDDALSQWKQANKDIALEANKFRDTKLKKAFNDGDLTPELVSAALFSKNKSGVERLYNSLSPEGQRTARAGLISKAMEGATFDNGAPNPTRFLNNLNRLQDQTGVVFHGDDKRYLDGITKLLSATRHAQEASAAPKTGFQALIASMQVAPLGVVAGHPEGALPVLYGGMAKMYESAPARNMLIRLSKMRAGTEEFRQTVNTINGYLSGVLGAEAAE